MKLIVRDDMKVDSRVISEHCEIEHKAALQLLSSHLEVIESEFGRVAFQMGTLETKGGKQKVRFALLTELQATFLITLMRNTKRVVQFKATLVKAFDQMRQLIARRQGVPDWKTARIDAATGFRILTQVLQERRLQDGKDVKPHHFMNEARLLNWTVLGEFKGKDRQTLSKFELAALSRLEVTSAIMIARGWDYERRKQELPGEFAKFKQDFAARISHTQPQLLS